MTTRKRAERLLSAGQAVVASSETTWWCDLPGEAEVDLACNVGPFFGLAQPQDQFFKGRCMLGGELKPGQEVEGLSEVTPVVQPPRDRRYAVPVSSGPLPSQSAAGRDGRLTAPGTTPPSQPT